MTSDTEARKRSDSSTVPDWAGINASRLGLVAGVNLERLLQVEMIERTLVEHDPGLRRKSQEDAGLHTEIV
jgi:hypothetical protein